MKLQQVFNEEENVALQKGIAFSKERKVGHDEQVLQVAKILADAGLKGHVWVFGDRSTHDDLKYGDLRVDDHKIDHKSMGSGGFFVSYRSAQGFEEEYYSTLDRQSKPVFIDVRKNQIKSRADQAEQKGDLKTANGFSSNNREEYKKNGYRIKIGTTPEGKDDWRDLGIRLPLSQVDYLTLEEFVKKMKDVS